MTDIPKPVPPASWDTSASSKGANSFHYPQGGYAPGNPWAFKPGQSGNPAGRPKSSTEMKQIAASQTELALSIITKAARVAERKLQKALDILDDPKILERPDAVELLKWANGAIERDGLEAAKQLLDRGHGRPQQKVDIDTTTLFSEMSREERAAYIIAKGSRVTTAMVEARDGDRGTKKNADDRAGKARTGGKASKSK